jgi:O-antigen/teichoic acid export membrane protein
MSTVKETGSENHDETATRTLKAAKWVSLGVVAQKGYQFVSLIILARLLTPDDFGIVALGTLVIGMLDQMKQLGMQTALIQRQDNIDLAANCSFWSSVGLSVIALIVVYFTAPFIGEFFDNEEAVWVLRVMALQFIFSSSIAVHRALAIKKFRFKKQTTIWVVEGAAGMTVSIILAIAGFGVWALVCGPLVGAAVVIPWWWVSSKWRPTPRFSWKILTEMLGFGFFSSLAATLDGLINTFNKAFISRYLGNTSLGIYDLSFRAIQLPYRSLMSISNQVALPAFSKEQNDTIKIRSWYLKMIQYSFTLLAPIAALLVFLGDYIVPILYGEKWIEAGRLVQILGTCIFFLPLLYAWPVYVARNRMRLLTSFTVVRLLVAVPLLYIAAQYDLETVCITEVGLVVVFALINIALVGREIGLRPLAILKALRTPIEATASFTFMLIMFRWLFWSGPDRPELFALLLAALPLAIAYFATLYFRDRNLFDEMKRNAMRSVK